MYTWVFQVGSFPQVSPLKDKLFVYCWKCNVFVEGFNIYLFLIIIVYV